MFLKLENKLCIRLSKNINLSTFELFCEIASVTNFKIQAKIMRKRPKNYQAKFVCTYVLKILIPKTCKVTRFQFGFCRFM